MPSKLKLLTAGILLVTGISTAEAQIYRVTLTGASEIPPVSTNGSGSGIVTFNSITHEMRVNTSFTGLTAPTSAAHIHCCVVQPANAGVATTLPSFVGFPLGVQSGTFDNTYDMRQPGTWSPAFIAANGGTPAGAEAALLTAAAAGQPYLNIHSTLFPGGEIRGTLQRHSFVPNATPRAVGLAAALDALGAGTGALNTRLIALASSTPAVQAAVMEQLLPTSTFATEMMANNVMTTTFDQISYRLQGLRLFSVNAPAVVTPQAGDNGVWLKAVRLDSEQETDEGFIGYESDGWDVAAGFDSQLTEDLSVGVAVNYAENEFDHEDLLSGSGSEIDSLQATVYATQGIPGGGYVEGMLAYAGHDVESQRSLGAAGFAMSDQDADQWGVRIGAGVVGTLTDALTFTPQVRFDWTRLDLDDYSESSATGLGLAVNAESTDRVRASIGAQFDMNTGLLDGNARPFLRLFWNHHFEDDGMDATTNFAGGAPFITPGQPLDRGNFTWGVGVNVFNQANLSGTLSYDSTVGDSYRSHVIQGKVYWAF